MKKLSMLWLATIAIFPPPSAGVSQTPRMHEWQTLQAALRADNVQVIVSDDEIRRIRMRKSDISRDHGFLDIDWTQREEAEVELLQLSQDTYVVINVKARRLLKAPLGTWHVASEGVPAFGEDGTWRIVEDDDPDTHPMLSIGDRIQGAIDD